MFSNCSFEWKRQSRSCIFSASDKNKNNQSSSWPFSSYFFAKL